MSTDNTEISGMRPKVGDTSLTLPITFDYSGGRREAKKSKIMWSVILGVIGTIVGVGIIFSKQGTLFTNVLFGLGEMFAVSLVIRFLILKEGKIRSNMITLKDNDYQYDSQKYWGIYRIENSYPYYCRFRNGKSGLFIRLEKDVILGKYSESEYEHYEAIGDALNLAGDGKIQICHIDYMDNVGTDERLEDSFAELGRVQNTDLKDLLTDTFSYLQRQMSERVTTFDVYLFLWTGSDIGAWNSIQRIIACFLQANYRSFHILNTTDLRDFTKTLNNMLDFSTVDAMSNAFEVGEYSGVVAISKEDMFGNITKYNKTREEKREEREAAEKMQEAKKNAFKKKSKKKSKKKGNKDDDDELIDIFK